MNGYEIETIKAAVPGASFTIRHVDYGRQLWVTCHTRRNTRITRVCAICREHLQAIAYRPVTNKKNRADRICRKHEPKE